MTLKKVRLKKKDHIEKKVRNHEKKASFKILLFCKFPPCMYPRHGDNGSYLFFSTTDLKLSNGDPNIGSELF